MESQQSGGSDRPLRPSSVRKAEAILDAAESIFLRHGYAGAGMDEVSARAQVSKQTIYSHFGGKEPLFLAVVTRVTAEATSRVHHDEPDPETPDDLVRYLETYALRQLDVVLDDRLLAVRRLVIAEAVRFPHLALEFWTQGPASATAAMRRRFARFARAGLLRTGDPASAARSFNWLVMGEALNAAMLRGTSAIPDATTRRRTAQEATRVFLAAYGTASSSPSSPDTAP